MPVKVNRELFTYNKFARSCDISSEADGVAGFSGSDGCLKFINVLNACVKYMPAIFALSVVTEYVLCLAGYLIASGALVPMVSFVKHPSRFPCVNMRSKFICVYDIVCINHHVIFCAQRLNNCLDILFKTPVVGVLFVIYIGIPLYDAFLKQFIDSRLRGRFNVGLQRKGIVSVCKKFLLLCTVTIKINVISFFGENEQVCGIFVSEDYIRQHFRHEVFRLSLCFCFVCFFNEVYVCGYKHCGKYCDHRNNYYQLHNREAASFVLFCHSFVSLHIEIMIFYIHPQTRENSEKTSRQA